MPPWQTWTHCGPDDFSMKTLKAIDVCAGAGGWAVAARGLPIEIVAGFDLQRDALQTYALNHPSVETIICDVTHHDFCRWKGIDLILGGIPCEQLSAARRMSRKESDRELALLDALIARFLGLPTELGAKYFCYEDVVQIERRLPILTPHFVVESASHSPQRRKRAYIGNLPAPEKGANRQLLRDALRKGPFRVGPRLHGRRPLVSKCFTPETFYPWMPGKKNLPPSPRSARAGMPRPASLTVISGASLNGRRWPPSRVSRRITFSTAAPAGS